MQGNLRQALTVYKPLISVFVTTVPNLKLFSLDWDSWEY